MFRFYCDVLGQISGVVNNNNARKSWVCVWEIPFLQQNYFYRCPNTPQYTLHSKQPLNVPPYFYYLSFSGKPKDIYLRF